MESWSREKRAALYDYVEKYVCAYICSLAVACHQGPFPVFCPVGKTQPLGTDPVVECLAFMQLAPGVGSAAQMRRLGTTEKGAMWRPANFSKISLWYSSLISVQFLSSRTCLVSIFIPSGADGLYRWLGFTNMLTLCWDKCRGCSWNLLVWHKFSTLLVWDCTFGLFMCCWESKSLGKLCHHCKGRAAGQCS